MKQYILIKADTNDADYVMEKSEITDEQLELIKPLIEAIKNFKSYEVQMPGHSNWTHGHNYPCGDCVREDLGEKSGYEYYKNLGFSEDTLDLFGEFLPYGEYGIHSIESITVIIVQEEIELL